MLRLATRGIYVFSGGSIEGTSESQRLIEYAQHLRTQATVGFNGCIAFRLASLKDEELKELIRAADWIAGLVSKKPEMLSATSLNKLGLGGGMEFQRSVEPGKLQALARVFVDLLQGQWLYSAGDKESLPSYWMSRQ